MNRRRAMWLWIAVAIGVWNAIYDPYIERGVRASLQYAAEAELGLGPAPAIGEVMAGSSRHGAQVATIWASIVLLVGWLTTRRSARSGSPSP